MTATPPAAMPDRADPAAMPDRADPAVAPDRADRTDRTDRADPIPDLGIVDGLVQMSTLVVSVIAEVATPHEISMLQCRLLGVLRDREPTMAQLARLLGLDKSSTTGLVDRAQRRGFVERVADPDDGRAWRVVLTAGGRAVIDVALADVTRQIAALTDGLTDADRNRLSRLASQIVARHADRHGIDPTAGMTAVTHPTGRSI